MKITIEQFNYKYTIEMSDDIRSNDCFNEVIKIMDLLGYARENIHDSVVEYVYNHRLLEDEDGKG